MTYNVQAPGWNQNRRTQVVGTIDAERPDVLGLHEARANGNGAELMTDLEDDYEPHFTNTGDPIYLRRDRSFAVVEEGVEALPICPGIGGAAVLTWVKIETPEGKRFTFYNTHFCVSQLPGGGQVSPEGNQMQAIATAEFMHVNTEPGTVHLLAGDLNAGQTSPTMLYLLEGQPLELNGVQFGNLIELDDTWELAPGNASQTHPGTGAGGGFTVLDWILADPFVNVVDAEVLQFDIPPGEEANYSDHLPVTATLQLSGIDNGAVLPPNSVVNGASFRPTTEPNSAIALGASVAIFGTNLASTTEVATSVPLSTTLGETSVTFNDIPAPLFFVSGTQINAQVPFELMTGAGTVTVQVKRGSETSMEQPIGIAAVSPGIFTLNEQGTGQGAILIANTPFLAAPAGVLENSRPAQRGEFISIFCTGLGPVLPEVPSGNVAPSTEPLAETLSPTLVNIADIPALVTFSGLAPGFVGLYQVNVQVPMGVPSGVQEVEIIINGVPGNTVTIAVQ